MLNFVLVSFVENCSVMMAMLSLFRFHVRNHLLAVLGLSIVLAFVSHALFVQYDVSMAPLIQLVLFILALRYLFYIHFFYSIIMAVFYTIFYVSLQALVIAGSVQFGIYSQESLQNPTSPQMYSIQILTSLINFAIAFYCAKKNLGFTFVPTSDSVPVSWTGSNHWLAWSSAAGLVISLLAYMIFRDQVSSVFWLICLIGIIIVVLILRLIIRKEMSDD